MLLIPGYQLRQGSTLDKALLVKFMQMTYQEFFPTQKLSHLSETVDRYFSKETPLWWVMKNDEQAIASSSSTFHPSPVGCMWLGNAVDQVQGDRYTHIFLLYVKPVYRRQGIGTALMNHAENWAKNRGDRQIGLHVFQSNQPALNLYQQLGYQTQSFLMIKPLP